MNQMIKSRNKKMVELSYEPKTPMGKFSKTQKSIYSYSNLLSKSRPKSSLESLNKINAFNSENVPYNLDVLNLIIKTNPTRIDLSKVERKMEVLNRDESFKNKKLIFSPDKLFYRYNVVYGSKSQNLFRTYTPKMSPDSESVSAFVKNDLKTIEEINVLSYKEKELLFLGKCKDILVEPNDDLKEKFIDYIDNKCINRIIELSSFNMAINSMLALSNIIDLNKWGISRILLPNNNICDNGVEVLMKAIENNMSIVAIDLSSNNLGPKSGDIIFKTLINNHSVISLNLSSMNSGKNRNRIGYEGCKMLTELLQKNSYLEFLNLSHNSIKNEGFKYIITGLNNNVSLRHLNISKNDIGEVGAEYFNSIFTGCNLSYLNISHNTIKDEGMIAIGNALSKKKLNELRELNLENTGLTIRGVRKFLSANNSNRKLNCLNLNSNNFSDGGFEPLHPFLQTMGIKYLHLSDCQIGIYAFEFASLLTKSTSITHLDLSKNLINDKAFSSFTDVLEENHTLISLDLSRNFLTDSSVKPFLKNFYYNNTVKVLNFYNNHLKNESAIELINVLKRNTALEKINLEMNKIGIEFRDHVKACLNKNIENHKNRFIPNLKYNIANLQMDPNLLDQYRKEIKLANLANIAARLKFDEDMLKLIEKEKKDKERLENLLLENESLIKEIKDYEAIILELNRKIKQIISEFDAKIKEIQLLIDNTIKKNEDNAKLKEELLKDKEDRKVKFEMEKRKLVNILFHLKEEIRQKERNLKAKKIRLKELNAKLEEIVNRPLPQKKITKKKKKKPVLKDYKKKEKVVEEEEPPRVVKLPKNNRNFIIKKTPFRNVGSNNDDDKK